MTSTLIGFKEWASVCEALGSGRQSIILRKGGIIEDGGSFRPDHQTFLLLPTYWHQQADGLKPSEQHFLTLAESKRPADDQFAVRHFAAVKESYPVRSIDALNRLASLHVWSEAVVEERFHRWHEDVVHAMVVRVFQLKSDLTLLIKPEHRGCKSWVELDTPVSLVTATPVLSNADFADQSGFIARALAG